MKLKTDPTYQFEERKYSEDASIEEITAIKKSVYHLSENIILLKQLPVVSSFSILVTFNQIDLLAKQNGLYGLIIDVSESKKPDAIVRRAINDRFKRIPENIRHVAFLTKDNIIVKTVIKFVMFQSVLDSYSVNSTLEEAVLAINKVLND